MNFTMVDEVSLERKAGVKNVSVLSKNVATAVRKADESKGIFAEVTPRNFSSDLGPEKFDVGM